MDHADLVAASQPDELRATLAQKAEELAGAASHHHAGSLVSTRTASHQGHDIVIKTTYEITVDGLPFDVAMIVDNAGRVHYHGLPTRDFSSAIDLVKKAIDFFPGDFARPAPPAGHNTAGGHEGHP
ncbi:MAG: hypothetical protein ABIS47_11780 [Acidimicrobiales bacterium]